MKKPEALVVFLLIFAVYLTASLILTFKVGYISEEVSVRSGIASDLLAGNERGREGLVCSVWWAPLPTLLILTMGVFPSVVSSGAACGIISALGGALMCFFIFKTLIYLGIQRVSAYVILILVAFNPWILFYSSNGSSEALLLGVLAGTLWYFVLWHYGEKLSGLVGLSILASLLPLIKHQAVLFTFIMLVSAVVVSLMRGKHKLRRVEGTFFLAFFPTIYTVGLWFLFNWLIMGNFLYFLRGIYVNPIRPETTYELSTAYRMLGHLPLTGQAIERILPFFVQFLVMPFIPAAVVFLVLSLIRRRNIFVPVFLGLLAAMPLYHILMISRNQSFSITRDMLVVVPISAFLTAYFFRSIFTERKSVQRIVSVCVLVMLLVGTIGSYTFVTLDAVDMPLQSSRGFPFVAGNDISNEEMEIKKLILNKEFDSRIALVGFQGYNFIRRANGGDEFIHSINLNLPLILKNTRGKDLYIIVPRPAGLAAFDDINIELPDLYYLGETTIDSTNLKAYFMIENRDYPNWRVYTIIRPGPDETIFGATGNSRIGS